MFVCLGNICRSPAAEGVLRDMADKQGLKEQVQVASCGIGDWHLGHPPDQRIRQAASNRGIALTTKAKPFVPAFLEDFDYILAADHDVLEFLHRHAKTTEQKAKLHLMTAFAQAFRDQPVPDPYYEGAAAFEEILNILEDSCQGLLEEIKSKY